MKKNKFENYNDGILYYGFYKEVFNLKNIIEGKEFIENGKLFFKTLSIREEDRYSFDTDDSKLSLKLKVKKNNIIKVNHIVKINEEFYSIKNIDSDTNNLYIYLSNYLDELDRILYFYKKETESALVDSNYNFYKSIFANIKNINSVTNSEKEIANSIQASEKLKFKIKFDKDIAQIDANNIFKIKFEDRFYDIKQIIDINKAHEILEIEGEFDGIGI